QFATVDPGAELVSPASGLGPRASGLGPRASGLETLPFAPQARLFRADKDRRVPVRTGPVLHVLVRLADLVERQHTPHAGVDDALAHEVVVGRRLLVV